MSARTRNRFVRGAFLRPLGDAPNAKLKVMNMLKKLLSTFELPPAPPSSIEEDRSRLVRSTVAERSHGNVHLQLGEYYTREDLDKEVTEVKGFDFSHGTVRHSN